MWNKVSCNPVVQRRSQVKERDRFLQRLLNAKSTSYISKSVPKLPTLATSLNTSRKINEKMSTEQSLQSKTTSRDRPRSGSLLNMNSNSRLNLLHNNKCRIERMRQKTIENENLKLLTRLTCASSSYQKIRVKSESSLQKNKVKSMLFISKDTPRQLKEKIWQKVQPHSKNNTCKLQTSPKINSSFLDTPKKLTRRVSEFGCNR